MLLSRLFVKWRHFVGTTKACDGGESDSAGGLCLFCVFDWLWQFLWLVNSETAPVFGWLILDGPCIWFLGDYRGVW